MKKFFDKFEEKFLVILMVIEVILVFLQILSRKIFKVSMPWSEELARYMFIWLVWVGASYATKERKHIVIDVLYERVSPKKQRIFKIISTIIWIVFLVFMSYISIKLTYSVYSGNQIAVGSGMPMWIAYLAIPVGVIMMLIRLIQNIIYDKKHNNESSSNGGGCTL